MNIELSLWQYVVLGFFGFTAAWVDSIAGGGGIISIPAYLWMGLPPQFALGTNKLSASFSSITSSIRYFFSNNMDLSVVLLLAPFTLMGSIFGVKTILSFDSAVVNIVLSFSILAVGLYSIFHPSLGKKDVSPHPLPKYSLYFGILFAFLLGFYDGFFGPGTGSFLMFVFMKVFRNDYLHSCANARFLNFVSNITSLVAWGSYSYLTQPEAGIRRRQSCNGFRDTARP